MQKPSEVKIQLFRELFGKALHNKYLYIHAQGK